MTVADLPHLDEAVFLRFCQGKLLALTHPFIHGFEDCPGVGLWTRPWGLEEKNKQDIHDSYLH